MISIISPNRSTQLLKSHVHIVHYHCIDNPHKLCPICPLTEPRVRATHRKNVLGRLPEVTSQTNLPKNPLVKKAKKAGGKKVSNTLKKLIKALLIFLMMVGAWKKQVKAQVTFYNSLRELIMPNQK
jgi:hypothetical protein